MNSSIQPNRQLQYLFVALLLAGFAIPAMGKDPTPNHKEFTLNKTPANARWREVGCRGIAEGVDIRGRLKLKFGIKDFSGFGNKQFGPVDIDLTTGWSGACPNNGDCLVGFGKITNRKYTANTKIAVRGVNTEEGNEGGGGKATIKLFITAHPNPPGQGDPCPGCTPPHFQLVYDVFYKFDGNHRVKGDPTFKPAFGEIHCD
jgi:hypothetical protein